MFSQCELGRDVYWNHSHLLVGGNIRHFSKVPGLIVEDWRLNKEAGNKLPAPNYGTAYSAERDKLIAYVDIATRQNFNCFGPVPAAGIPYTAGFPLKSNAQFISTTIVPVISYGYLEHRS